MIKYISLFREINRAYKQHCKEYLAKYELTYGEIIILNVLFKNPKINTAKGISEVTGISQPVICRTVDKLILRGYLTSTRSNKDKRVRHLELAIKDVKLRKLLLDVDKAFDKKLKTNLTAQELNAFDKMLNEMLENVGA